MTQTRPAELRARPLQDINLVEEITHVAHERKNGKEDMLAGSVACGWIRHTSWSTSPTHSRVMWHVGSGLGGGGRSPAMCGASVASPLPSMAALGAGGRCQHPWTPRRLLWLRRRPRARCAMKTMRVHSPASLTAGLWLSSYGEGSRWLSTVFFEYLMYT